MFMNRSSLFKKTLPSFPVSKNGYVDISGLSNSSTIFKHLVSTHKIIHYSIQITQKSL